MIVAIVTLILLSVMAGLVVGYASTRFRVETHSIAGQVDALLPQTQCGQCGYPGCRPYAQAIARGEAEINLCVPGGVATVLALADLLGREPVPVLHRTAPMAPMRAVVDENECIGCTLCLQACPVDAIVGAAKYMHQVIASECTGCQLCVRPCPVECIHMMPSTLAPWIWPFPGEGRIPNGYDGI